MKRRSGRATLYLLLLVVVAVGAWAGPKVWRRLTAVDLHQVWVVRRHQEVDRVGQGLAILRSMRLEIPTRGTRIGSLLANLPLELVGGQATTLEERTRAGPVVLAHRAPADPLAAADGARLAALERTFGPRGVQFFTFYTAADAAAAAADREQSGLAGPAVLDPQGRIARELGLESTSDAFLIDAGRTLVYRGSIDNAAVRAEAAIGLPARAFLADALEQTLAARKVARPATRGSGEPLIFDEPSGPRGQDEITWTNRVERIFQYRCQACHHEGGSAPPFFESYAKARGNRGMVRLVLEDRVMPPWLAVHGSGPWRNGLELPEDERADLLAWIDAGAPEGDPADAPVALDWPGFDEWLIGEPDLVIAPSEPVQIPAEGIIQIQKFIVEVPFPEDRWVQAIQLLPSVPGVLHHSTIFIEPPGGRLLFLDALLPGKAPTIYPLGQARFIPKGSRFRFIIHYTAKGEAVEDTLRLGLRFTEEAPFREIHSIWMTNNEFVVPARAEHHEVTTEFVLPRDILIRQFMPHMHLRGKEFKAEALLPDGTRKELLHLPRWDLDWQYAYELFEPVPLPEGTTILCTGTYDNSANNPENPDPDRDVPFGQQTFDEMLGFGMDFTDP